MSKPVGSSRASKARKTKLRMPAVGMEAEFNVWVDGKEVVPEKFWKSPLDFIQVELLPREGRSSQIPTGGAVYFDRGVIEVVTPLIEIDQRCSARVVRSLWEQIAFVRDQLTRWEEQAGHEVRLRGYSSHYNVSYEIPESKQTPSRNIRKLALLLAYILPPPLMLLGGNRRSTGVGVRPRGDRVEITLDFTPEPSLMIVTAAAVIGIVRDVISWPSYELSTLEDLPIPLIDGVIPGKHTTRKGWLTKDFHYPRSPYTTDVDDVIWPCTDGETRSLREIGLETCRFFEDSISRYGDPFSTKLLFAILEGKSRSLLDLLDRPLAYDHVGVLCRWGAVLADRILEMSEDAKAAVRSSPHSSATDLIVEQVVDVRKHLEQEKGEVEPHDPKAAPSSSGRSPRPSRKAQSKAPRPPRTKPQPAAKSRTREKSSPRSAKREVAYPDRHLSRSVYERVFLALTSGKPLTISGKKYEAVGMDGWYRAIVKGKDGRKRSYTIDHLARQVDTLLPPPSRRPR